MQKKNWKSPEFFNVTWKLTIIHIKLCFTINIQSCKNQRFCHPRLIFLSFKLLFRNNNETTIYLLMLYWHICSSFEMVKCCTNSKKIIAPTGEPLLKGWQRRAEDFFHSSYQSAGKARRRAHKSSNCIEVKKNAH